jgi:hypothetical protein
MTNQPTTNQPTNQQPTNQPTSQPANKTNKQTSKQTINDNQTNMQVGLSWSSDDRLGSHMKSLMVMNDLEDRSQPCHHDQKIRGG